MTGITSQIQIETENIDDIKSILEKHLGIADIMKNNQSSYGLNISLMDCKEEVDYTVEFLRDNDLTEQGPLDQYYNYSKSKVVVFLTVNYHSLFTECFPEINDGVAKFISRKMKLKCAVFIEDSPMCVYDCGKKIFSLAESYRLYDSRFLI